MRINWKKFTIIAFDFVLAVYLLLAFTSFNKPRGAEELCTKVSIHIEDETTDGFLKPEEIKKRLLDNNIYPLSKPMRSINSRQVETMLKRSPFVKTAECYKTQNHEVHILLTQRMPVVRIKSDSGEDYYVDDHNCIMPNSSFTSDIIIATGHISKSFAQQSISEVSKTLFANDLWRNQIEQINVLPDNGIELIPRVGDHAIYIGTLPQHRDLSKHEAAIRDFVNIKMDRLEKFYRYGLSQTGWNKYKYINLEFDNQIICKRR